MNQLTTVPPNSVLDMLSVDAVIDDRLDTFETDVAAFDLRMVARLREPLRIDALEVSRVTGVALLASGDPSAGGVDAGRIVLTDADGERIALPLERSAATRRSWGCQTRRPRPSGMACRRIRCCRARSWKFRCASRPSPSSRAAGVLDVRGLSLLLENGSSVGVLLRPGPGMLVERAGDLTITRRAQEAQRIWMPVRVGVTGHG